MLLPIHIRWMIKRDMAEVMEIEKTNFTNAWSYDDFIQMLRQRDAIGMVAEYKENVIGYMIYELRSRSLRLVNIAVQQNYCRRGIGRADGREVNKQAV